jgi:hypothetical protein
MTKASLVDNLAKAKQTRLVRDGTVTYHSLLVAAEEFSVLMPSYDLEYIGTLNSIYNNKRRHSEDRRHGPVKQLVIDYPQLNILGGAQPGWLASVFPEEAWSTGLTARIIMVYSSETPFRELFQATSKPKDPASLLAALATTSQMYGEMLWTPEAQQYMADWHRAGGPPIPRHSKLEHYVRRRTSLHVPKLCMISAVARNRGMLIELCDVKRAIAWLTTAEAMMPDIFRAMVGKSDREVIEELHLFAVRIWAKQRDRAVPASLLWEFLAGRLPSDKIGRVLEVAERSGVLVRNPGETDYWPRPKHEHGLLE